MHQLVIMDCMSNSEDTSNSSINDPEVKVRLANEDDRTYVQRLIYLTNVFGDEQAEIRGETLARDIAVYVDDWSPLIDGGVIAVSELSVPAGGAWLRYYTGERKGDAYMGNRASGVDTTDETQWTTKFDPETIPELCIAVERRYAGLGVGKLLLESVCDLAKEQGAPAITLWVNQDNPRARRLYEAFGFEDIEIPGEGPGPMIKYF